MTNDSFFLEIMIRQRQAEYDAMAEEIRLRAQIPKKGSGKIRDRVWTAWAEFLIRTGESIKSRHTPCLAACSDGAHGINDNGNKNI